MKEVKISATDNFKAIKEERCPSCNYKLQRRTEGLACIHHGCALHFKIGKGWVFLQQTPKQKENKFIMEYMFRLGNNENQRRMAIQKRKVLIRDDYKCRFCSNERDLPVEVHHIIARHIEPALTFDLDNLIVACEECHEKLHSNDKRRWNKYGR